MRAPCQQTNRMVALCHIMRQSLTYKPCCAGDEVHTVFTVAAALSAVCPNAYKNIGLYSPHATA